MDVIADLFLSKISHRYDAGDLADRASYNFTTLLLAIFSATLMATQVLLSPPTTKEIQSSTATPQVGKPIQCWFPAQYHDTWESYAETYCYVKNTYSLKFTLSFSCFDLWTKPTLMKGIRRKSRPASLIEGSARSATTNG